MSTSDSLQKAEMLWFSTDVVVLQAGTRIFRVFAAILKAQSTVFAEMFTFPQPSIESAEVESMDGFPVVRLHDDPDEVEVFLKAIFDSSFFMPPSAKPVLEHTLGILRLSHKYDVPYLRRRAIEHLEPTYPTTLIEYDERRRRRNPLIKEAFDPKIATLKVAAEVGTLWLLPVVYHELCKLPLSTLLSAPGWNGHEEQRNACVVGYSRQNVHSPDLVNFLTVLCDDDSTCDHWTKCNKARLQSAAELVWPNMMTWTIDWWDHSDWTDLESLGLCTECMNEARHLYDGARQEFWDCLPHMFGLPPWDELEEMRRVALST